uniref:Uncharacterized protein n=1 Tax=Candidatus Kentrum sp. LFY TaxID=2126342 RepID=A0A450UX77_9GAMM|nr:MAG: hypothetical protein BECKLFY1418B_GA0070995_10962 [Candidatus Kentron sp. LFY]
MTDPGAFAHPPFLQGRYKRKTHIPAIPVFERRLCRGIDSRYRKNKNSERTSVLAKTHPASVLARSANMSFTILSMDSHAVFLRAPIQFPPMPQPGSYRNDKHRPHAPHGTANQSRRYPFPRIDRQSRLIKERHQCTN